MLPLPPLPLPPFDSTATKSHTIHTMKKTLLLIAAGAALGYLLAPQLGRYPGFSNAYLFGASTK